MLKLLDKTWHWRNRGHYFVTLLLLFPSFFFFGPFSLLAYVGYVTLLWLKPSLFSNSQNKLCYVLFAPFVLAVLLGFSLGLACYYVEQPRIRSTSGSNLDPTYRLYGQHQSCLAGWIDIALEAYWWSSDQGSKLGALVSPSYHDTYKGPYPTHEQSMNLLSHGQVHRIHVKKVIQAPFKITQSTVNAILFDAEFGVRTRPDFLVGARPSALENDRELPKFKSPAFLWATCGEHCVVLRLIETLSQDMYVAHESIFLVDTQTSIIFARYLDKENIVSDEVYASSEGQ